MDLGNIFQTHFNNKDIEKLLTLFSEDVFSSELFTEGKDFSSKTELSLIYKNLFEINPHVQCEIVEEVVSENKVCLVKSYFGFSCGAKSKTVWNLEIVSGKIKKVLHFSQNYT
jgi:hypothetical protein